MILGKGPKDRHEHYLRRARIVRRALLAHSKLNPAVDLADHETVPSADAPDVTGVSQV